MPVDVQSLLRSGAALTDAALERLLPAPTVEPHSLHRAMRHSTFAGGKRLRPTLALEAARAVTTLLAPGTADLPSGAAELGAALEMVHTYSLIHDDLPALDNDDLRRGQPTCHVVFGEAIAILAGDALQTLAFQTLAALPAPASTVVEVIHEFALAIGTGVGAPSSDSDAPAILPPGVLPPGMIGGQVLDLESEGVSPTPALVERIHRAKTGALITTSIVCGGLLGLGTQAHDHTRDRHPLSPPADLIAALRRFGQSAGLAFQIVDDILDVTQTSADLGKTSGKDTASAKATWPAAFAAGPGPSALETGLARARQDADALVGDAFAALTPLGPAADSLKAIARFLVERTH